MEAINNQNLNEEFNLTDEELFARIDNSTVTAEKITAPRYS